MKKDEGKKEEIKKEKDPKKFSSDLDFAERLEILWNADDNR